MESIAGLTVVKTHIYDRNGNFQLFRPANRTATNGPDRVDAPPSSSRFSDDVRHLHSRIILIYTVHDGVQYYIQLTF